MAWILIQALAVSAILPAFARADTLRGAQIENPSGLEELKSRLETKPPAVLQPVRQSGLEEWVGAVDWGRWVELTDPDRNLIQSFSGIRGKMDQERPLRVTGPLGRTELSPEYKLVFARYGYLFAKHQIRKFKNEFPEKKKFAFVLGRDPRPSGQSVIETQMRGMLVAAREEKVEIKFIDGGILPTPFVESLVRMTGADGGVIATASHNQLEWNGVKYPTAEKEPGGSLVEGGILLPAEQMAEIVLAARRWIADVGKDPTIVKKFKKNLDQVSLAGKIRTIPGERVLKHAVGEARRMWGLEDPKMFQAFQERAQQVKIVVDPNGGAACGYYLDFLRAFGFEAFETNGVVGRPQHLIEPVRDAQRGDGLADAETALKAHRAQFAIVTDFDADRANTLLVDPVTGQVIEPPNPQEVTTMNVALAFAREQILRQKNGDKRPLAVVVHDATSRRAWKVAEVFGAQVFVVEVGEVNVLERMRQLERQGYRAVSGIEGANGGTVFRGDHTRFLGDTSRNGAMTGFFLGMVAVDPAISRTWLMARNAAVPKDVPAVPVPEVPTLVDVLNSLPGDRGVARWHFETPIVKHGEQGEVPEALIVPFKRGVETFWYERQWPILREKGLVLGDGSVVRFSDFRIVHHSGTRESPAYGLADPPGAGLSQYGQGGWILELDLDHPDGEKAFLWFRGSLTEGILRVSAEGQGPRAHEIAGALLTFFRKDLYPQALARAKAASAADGVSAGLEEGRLLKEVIPDPAVLPVHYPAGVIRDLSSAQVVLVTADAGKGTRFTKSGGGQLKMIAPVGGLPAGVRTKLAAAQLGWPVVSVVGYRKEDVMTAYNAHMNDVIYVESEDPTGGTGYGIYHAAAVAGLKDSNALVIATMGDQPLYDTQVLQAVERMHRESGADLVIGTALFSDPTGKGRVVRDLTGKILGILEEKDIQEGKTLGGYSTEQLLAINEGNVSIYAMPAKPFFSLLEHTRNKNAQRQFYLTDIVRMVLDQGGRVEAVQIDSAKAPDLTTAEDLRQAEAYLAQQKQSGLEEPATVEAAARAWFQPNAARADEKKLEEWLSSRGEEAIHQFMRLIAEDRGISVEALGHYQIPSLRIDSDQLKAAVQQYPEVLGDKKTGQSLTPERYYDDERLHLMAAVAVQRALGRQVLVEVGMGYVGTASGLVHANTVVEPRRLPHVIRGRHYRSPIRDPETYPFFVIMYQRPSGSFYKILHARQGVVPITTSDTRAPLRLREALDRGTLFATPLAEAIAVSDIVFSETELEPDDRNPDDPLESRIAEGPTLRLLDRVAGLIPDRETLILIVSTVTPGFTKRAWDVIGRRLIARDLVYSPYEALVAHAPTRLQPGANWTQWLEFQRLAAPADSNSEKPLRAYLDLVYSPENRRHFEIKTPPPEDGAYKIHHDPVTIEVEKSWENSWRNRLYELGVLLLQLGDELGFNAFEVAEEIAKARPATHGLTNQMAHLVGGFCVTNQDKQILTALYNELAADAHGRQFAELELQRYFRSVAAARAVLAARARDFVMDYLLPALEQAQKRPDRFKLLVAGVAYRGETDETRQSGPEAFARHVLDIGGSGVRIFAADPRVRYWLETVEQDLSHPGRISYGMRNQESLRRLQVESDLLRAILRDQPDAIVMTTRHLEYLGMGQPAPMRTNASTGEVYPGLDPIEMIACAYGRTGIVLGDTFNFFSDEDLLKFLAHGWIVFGVGKGHIQTRLIPQITDRRQLDVAHQVLARLEKKQGDPAFDPSRLKQAIEAQRLRVESFRADATTAGLEEGPTLAHTQADLAAVELELEFPGDPDRQAVLEAQKSYLQAQIRALRSRRAGDKLRAEEARRTFEELSVRYLAAGAAHMKDLVVAPSFHGLSREMVRLMRLLNALAPYCADPNRLLLPPTVSLLGKVAQNTDMVWRDARGFHRTLDRLMEAVLSPEQKLALAHQLRIAEIPEELAVPKPLPPDEQARLKKQYDKPLGRRHDGLSFLPAFMYVPEPGKGFRKIVASDGSTMFAVVKFPPDLAMSDQEIRRRQWGKHTIEVFPNEAEAEILEYEKYPDFQGLPWEFRLYLDDLVRRERVLTTMDGAPQNKIGWVMPINLDEKTPQHRRGRLAIPFFADDRRPVVGTSPTSGAPMVVEWKGTGPHVGGSPAGLKLEKAELRAGGGGKGVGRQVAYQIPGHMSSGEEVITLARMRLTPQYQTGDPAPPVPLARVRFRYKDDPLRQEYEIVLRGGPSSRRLGHRLVDGSGGVTPAEAANKMGWAAAFLLGMDPLAVHIALNGDNLYDNGMPTDTASFISVADERDPKDAFFEYFSYEMKHMLYTFQQIDDKDWGHPHAEYLKDWLNGFFGYLLSLQGEGRVHDPALFQKYTQLSPEQLAAMTAPDEQFVKPLVMDLWKYYVSYRVLEHRVALHGYDSTMESAYSSTHEADKRSRYHPELKGNAQAFLKHQKEVLGLARRLIRKNGYPPLTHLSGPRAGQPFDFKAAFIELDQKQKTLRAFSNGDYGSFYRLGFYDPRRPEHYDIIHPENSEREGNTWLQHEQGYEKPSTAQQARARLEEASRNSTPNRSGLEELPLSKAISLGEAKRNVIYPDRASPDLSREPYVFISADAGRSSRFEKSIFSTGRQGEFASPSVTQVGAGTDVISKVIVPLAGQPAGWRPKAAAQSLRWPVVVVVGHQREQVMARYNARATAGITYVVQENASEGNAAAFWRALAAGNLQYAADTTVILTMGDHPLYDRKLLEKIRSLVESGADLVIGTALVGDPTGKGRIVRDRSTNQIVGIVEQRDIDSMHQTGVLPDWLKSAGYQYPKSLQGIQETNASIYAIKAERLAHLLAQATNQNAQGQYYITDIVSSMHQQIVHAGEGRIEAVNIPEWQAIDLTEVKDLAAIERNLTLHAAELQWAAGLEEVPTLTEWDALLKDPVRSQEVLAPQYPEEIVTAKRQQILQWFKKVDQIQTPEGTQAFFPDARTVVARTPGRIPLPLGGRHLDYIGFMGGSLGLPIRQEIMTFVQVADGLNGAVEIYLVDHPDANVRKAFEKGPRTFSLSTSWVNPPPSLRTLPEWDAWAAQVTRERRRARLPDLKINYADDIIASLVSILRTDFGDPSGRARAFFEGLIRDGKGLRIGIASDLPTGGGLSSSSAILEGTAQAINLLAGMNLSTERLIQLGYAERFYVGTQGGVKDHAHLLYDAAFLGSGPTRLIQQLASVPGVSLLLLDSGISRDNAKSYSPKLQGDGDDEQNIKGRTGIGYALGALWIRHHHPELADRLRPNQDPSNPYGFLRELMPGTPTGLPLANLYRLLKEIPSEGLTRQHLYEVLPEFRSQLDGLFRNHEDPLRPYPVREMLLFGFSEEARNWKTAEILHRLKESSPQGGAFQELIQIAKAAHNGDRIVGHRISRSPDGKVQIQQEQWNWRVSDDRLDWLSSHTDQEEAALWRQPGWLERSIEPVDRLVDLVEFFNQGNGGNVAAGVIIGAGLGGSVVVLVQGPYVSPLLDFLQKNFYVSLGVSPSMSVVALAGKPAGLLKKPSGSTLAITKPFSVQNSGLEERIPLPAGVTVGKVVFVGPDVAGAMIGGLKRLQPAAGERLGVVMFARDASQKQQIEAGLEEAGMTLLEPVVDVSAPPYRGDRYAAVADRQMVYFARNMDVHVLFTRAGLEELGKFLRIPDASFRTWKEQIERGELAPQA